MLCRFCFAAFTREEAFIFVNGYAPEHLAVSAEQYLTRFEHAGEISGKLRCTLRNLM